MDHDHWRFGIIQILNLFASFSLGATYLLCDGLMLLYDMISLLGFFQWNYWLQAQVKQLVAQKKKRFLLVRSSSLYQKLHAQS